MNQEPYGWHKSSFSNPQGANCVEVGSTGNGAAVRDTKDRAAGFFTATPEQWGSFLAAIKHDRFNG